MKVHKFTVPVPPGYCLVPYPKQWLREYEKIRLQFDFKSHVPPKVTVESVLSLLSSHSALIDWTTAFAGTKGMTSFIVGLKDDYIYYEPIHNRGQEFQIVTVRGSDIRLFAELPKKRNV
jgi:hypothetical protein